MNILSTARRRTPFGGGDGSPRASSPPALDEGIILPSDGVVGVGSLSPSSVYMDGPSSTVGAAATRAESPCGDDYSSPETIRCLFHNAYVFLNPSTLFRFVVYLYAERKLLVFYWAHFFSTMIIWIHFFLIKFEEQKEAVPEGAPYYTLKRLAPPLEFGSMHAILFQMALIPLTMSRYSIATLSSTKMNAFIPLNRIMRIHIYLGYLLFVILGIASCFFLAFFGIICASGDEKFCDKFTSEIMITGYAILATLLIIVATSYLRYKIPYEVFYVIHHLVFILYALTIAHTFDISQRSGEKERSQTFKWFSLTLLYYICDRLAMHFHHSYRTKLMSASAVTGSDQSRMLILKVKRPPLFFFRPGQYAFLKVNSLGPHWHPYSIASGPSSPYLEFYVEKFDEGSWTDMLWKSLEADHSPDQSPSPRMVEVQVMGPVGTGLATTREYSHALAIGTGTGIVPILSLFNQHVRQLLRLAPEAHNQDLKELQNQVLQVENAEEPRKGSMMHQIVSACRVGCGADYESLQQHQSRTDTLRDSIQTSASVMFRDDHKDALSSKELRSNMKEFKMAAYQTTRSIYGVVLLGIMPVLGVGLIGFTISWNTVDVDIPVGWLEFLQACTVLFQILYAVIAIFVWDANQFFAYTDVALCLVAPFADWYWMLQYEENGVLSPGDITICCLMAFYMTFRAWCMTVKPRTNMTWRTGMDIGVSTAMERLDVMWVTRSASLVSEILPDVNALWEDLVASWGLEHTKSVCRFNVYVTDQDEGAVRLLQRELASTKLYQNGFVHFGRPDIGQAIEDHSVELICTRRSSYTLLAYVGSPELAREIHECKLFNDMKVGITGNKKHQMEFVSESYGGVKAKRSAAVPPIDLTMSKKDIGSTDDDKHANLSVGDSADQYEAGDNFTALNLNLFEGLSQRRTTSYDEGGK